MGFAGRGQKADLGWAGGNGGERNEQSEDSAQSAAQRKRTREKNC